MVTKSESTRLGDIAVLRRVWRLHFWVAVFAAPVLVVLACSGLVILYSQPLDAWLNADLTTVSPGAASTTLDAQLATAEAHLGAGYVVDAVTPPATADRSTRIDFLPPDLQASPQAEKNVVQVFVDPYTGDYLGQRNQLSGLVGWANQIHRMFGNDGLHVQLPSLGHLIDPAAYPSATIPVGVGNLWMELTATWILVLLGSGLYLWWPRAVESAKPLLRIRWGQGGRMRWRDLHALTGVVIAVVLIGYVLSGMTWSRYWGENWRAFSATVAPSATVDAPSTAAKLGDYDRLGRRIAWAAKDDAIPASNAGGAKPARLSFEDVDRIAKTEGMLPGYAIIPPADSSEGGDTVYGSYAVVNASPQKTSEQRTVYLDQFSGTTLASATAAQDGALTRLTSLGIAMHMGNQLGVWTRILATVACLAVLTMVATGLLMWWKRRPRHGAGLPARPIGEDRPTTPRRAGVTIWVAAAGLGILFPVFGVSLLVVLTVEWALGIGRRRKADRGQAAAPVDASADREVPAGALASVDADVDADVSESAPQPTPPQPQPL